MATELPPPSPTPAEESATVESHSLTGAPDMLGAPDVGKPADDGGNARQQHTADVRCDRCGRFFPPALIHTDASNLMNLCARCGKALAELVAAPIIDANAPVIRLTEIYVIAAVDAQTGDEGIMAMQIGGGQLEIPLVAQFPAKVQAMVQWARVRADNEGLKYRVYRCSQLEDVTDKAIGASAQPTQP